ncbi:flagellar hook-associated protein FlgK [Pseudohongiella sp. SYSU M77423]|uniref:flagellar hook-associated protein FlgK n=1 Tax=Pseudohongiella sp. SYSU M77423 TaxID=3042312 RepID=UPI002481755C|nr:flagellar hook-associated protein FlgK [Pseudohongiella sp. SYSU M77423]MDH7944883.1 flagellar hook-associated protein FlgK [Pseudohongiella sp. SYSU M77423]
MSTLLNTAITGIRLNQTAMSVTGQNIVNANTEGYSRQSVNQSTNQAIRTAAGFIGTGVSVDEIVRNSQKYLVDQVLRDVGSLSDSETYLTNVTQINNLLASEQTNLSSYVNQFFDALNESVNEPGSMLGRELLLTQAQQLSAGFKSVDARLQEQKIAVNKQLQGAAENITALGRQIAALNQSIGDATFESGAPNDLLDKLDLLVRELGSYVNVTTSARQGGGLDIYIGQGQPLVAGTNSFQLRTIPGEPDPTQFDLAISNKVDSQNITYLLSGGSVGGLLRFREDALQPALGSVGLLATGLAAKLNEQNQLGMDLEGSLGGNIFTDINHPTVAAGRVVASPDNRPPADRELSVTIDDVSKLNSSNYELSFPGSGRQYVLKRLSDDKVMMSGMLSTTFPQVLKVDDGFSIKVDGGTFQQRDSFLIRPVSSAVTSFNVQIARAEEFAFASPVKTSASMANQGGAEVVTTRVDTIDTPAFSDGGALSPPMIVRFTSATTYDVLDYSDPANPVPLDPPLTNLTFTPGANNVMLPSTPGGTTVVSQGAAVAQLQIGSTNNGYPGETLRIQTTDPDTGFIKEQQLALALNESAASMAARLSSLNGVDASAHTFIELTDFQPGAPGNPLQISFNGANLTDVNWTAPGQAQPSAIPDPLTPDFLRDRINNDPALQAQGIYAKSDGINLRIYGTSGEDFDFNLDAGGSVRMGEAADLVAPAGTPVSVTIGGTVEVRLAANTDITSNQANGVFGQAPEAKSNYTGIQLVMTSGNGPGGQPRAGDRFMIAYNTDGTADNRNGSQMLALQDSSLLGNGTQNYQDVYGQLAERVGILTSQARVNVDASESMLRQSMDASQSVSGVNLEEEAARLIQLEQHYNASARLITLARDLFDTLLGM